MVRICVEKATNKLLEMQSLATEGTLTQNAVRAGYSEDEIEERLVTDEEFQTLLTKSFTPEQARTRKLTALAYYRWQKETEGITLNGVGIKTDRESQGLLNGALKLFDLNPLLAAIDWKGENGWVQVDKATLEAVGLAVGAHVQACFSREKAHATAIEALTAINDIEAYDITTGWPE